MLYCTGNLPGGMGSGYNRFLRFW